MSDPLSFQHSPFMRFLGLEVVRADRGMIEVRLPFREEFIRGDGSDWLHGGVVSALADIVGDYAVVTETGQGVPTIDLRVHLGVAEVAGDRVQQVHLCDGAVEVDGDGAAAQKCEVTPAGSSSAFFASLAASGSSYQEYA